MDIFGNAELELITADPMGALHAIENNGIELRQIERKTDLTLVFRVSRREIYHVIKLAERRGERIKIRKFGGICWYISGILKRPVLLAGLAVLIFLSLWTPGKVFFIQVEGNHAVPEQLILERAAECGITFGTTAREVRSENMKNKLLSSMEQLQWAGINTYGCVAVISVKERTVDEEAEDARGVSSIVASRDGIVDVVTVLQGSAACVPGQAVKEGQTLISGYTDCGIKILATQADGEVFAYTQRKLTAVSPLGCDIRGSNIAVEKKYSLLFGKKRINLYNNSGILDGSCVKMYSLQYVTLPGGFVLPLAILTETWIHYEAEEGNSEVTQLQLQEFASSYLSTMMTAGTIQSANETVVSDEAVIILQGNYNCYEMIGITHFEEIWENYGEDN